MLHIEKLKACINGVEILKGLDLQVNAGEIHAVMGPNGSGKSTFAKVLAGHPDYSVTGGRMICTFRGREIDLAGMAPYMRAREGIFVGFQYPVEVPGVTNAVFLREAYNSIAGYRGEEILDPYDFNELMKSKLKLLEMDDSFINRPVNEGFSGGEKKKNEILQMAVLNPELIILDETDSGLDIDALKIVANGINAIHTETNAILLITHYQRLLNFVEPGFVHILMDGKIVRSGKGELAIELEAGGYDQYIKP